MSNCFGKKSCWGKWSSGKTGHTVEEERLIENALKPQSLCWLINYKYMTYCIVSLNCYLGNNYSFMES